MCGAWTTAREVGRSITTISAGGGLPVPYRAGKSYVDLDAYFQLWDDTRRGWNSTSAIKLISRSSRAAIWWPRAAIWSPRFGAIKRMGANTFYLVDAGFNNLARPILYGSHHPMSIVLVLPLPRRERAPAYFLLSLDGKEAPGALSPPLPLLGEGRGEGDALRVPRISVLPPLTPEPPLPQGARGSTDCFPLCLNGCASSRPLSLDGRAALSLDGRGSG